MKKIDILLNSIEKNDLKTFKNILNEKNYNPNEVCGIAIRSASYNNNFEMVKLLMADSRVDPSVFKNEAFRLAIANSNFDIAYLLWKDNRVRKKLNENSIEYKKMEQINKFIKF